MNGNQNMKRCSTSLITRVMQISARKRYNYKPTRMTRIKKTDNTCVSMDVEKLKLLCVAGGNVK